MDLLPILVETGRQQFSSAIPCVGYNGMLTGTHHRLTFETPDVCVAVLSVGGKIPDASEMRRRKASAVTMCIVPLVNHAFSISLVRMHPWLNGARKNTLLGLQFM